MKYRVVRLIAIRESFMQRQEMCIRLLNEFPANVKLADGCSTMTRFNWRSLRNSIFLRNSIENSCEIFQ